jgi:hypothetical protein
VLYMTIGPVWKRGIVLGISLAWMLGQDDSVAKT